MTAHTRTSRLNRLFHKPPGQAHRRSRTRYGLLTFFQLIAGTTARLVPGKERKLAWQELGNKIRAFTFFEHINIILDIDPRSTWHIKRAKTGTKPTPPLQGTPPLEGTSREHSERSTGTFPSWEGERPQITVGDWGVRDQKERSSVDGTRSGRGGLESTQENKILAHSNTEEVVEKIRTFEPENRAWALEGVGYILAEQALKKKETPAGILQNEEAPWSLGGLQSGMGMALANRFLLNSKNHDTSPGSIEMLEHYHTLAQENSLPGCAGIPLESLGFIARLMHPEQVAEIDQHLQEIDTDFAAYFWHGAGRALCFLPQNMWPGCSFPWRAVEMAVTEAPHEQAYVNMLSGLAWPFTLVNLREPRILEYVLNFHRESLTKNDAFSKGICSAIVFTAKSIDDHFLIDAFLDHNPNPAEPGLSELWQRVVKEPCRKALSDSSPQLKNPHSWSELFKY